MSTLLAIDPGNTESGWVLLDTATCRPIEFDKTNNYDLRDALISRHPSVQADHFVIEMVASYGMSVGADVFETCVWIGRFAEAGRRTCQGGGPITGTGGHQADRQEAGGQEGQHEEGTGQEAGRQEDGREEVGRQEDLVTRRMGSSSSADEGHLDDAAGEALAADVDLDLAVDGEVGPDERHRDAVLEHR